MKIQLFIRTIKELITEPKLAFVTIKSDNGNPKSIILYYILPLVLLDALATFIGNILFGPVNFNVGLGVTINNIVMIVLVQLIAVFLSAYIVNELLPVFHVKKNFTNIFKLVAYSFTPIFLTAIAAGLLPKFSNIIYFFGFYSLVVYWIGSEVMIDITKDRKNIFVPLTILIMGVNYLAIRGILGIIFSI
ncbi:MAG: DUF1282 family protein [Salinivirgaceae bacterium]|nr:DUF1282 family protein [Salinivirgaceae bacterium]